MERSDLLARSFRAQLVELAEEHGTPLFVYRAEVARQRVALLRRHLPRAGLLYAVKANPHPGILKALRGVVDGLDVSSEGEIERALAAGYAAETLSFTGPAKSDRALQLAVERSVGAICVEAVDELERLVELAAHMDRHIRVRLRINPPEPIMACALVVGGRASPFGLELDELSRAAEVLGANRKRCTYLGPQFHAGSQCQSARAFARHIAQSLQLTRDIERQFGLEGDSVNLGGGFAVLPAASGRELDIAALARHSDELLEIHRGRLGREQRIVFEPGRYLVAPAGVFVASVRRLKRSRGTLFAILDGGINCMLAAGGGWSAGVPQCTVTNLDSSALPEEPITVVGPLCTPADVMGRDTVLATPRRGDRLVFLDAGAYGPTASLTEFIGHPRVKEVVVTDAR
jgi:diaminopimelate decarboxylase